MLTPEEKKSIIDLIHRQVVPAIGCTEPIAVALCVAKAKEILGSRPEHIELSLSGNIIKNAMGVGIPGTGMVGLPIAVALGALIGRSELQLEVLQDCNKQAVEDGKAFIAENRIHIALEENDPDKLYISVTCTADGHTSQAIIKGAHTNFVFCARTTATSWARPCAVRSVAALWATAFSRRCSPSPAVPATPVWPEPWCP